MLRAFLAIPLETQLPKGVCYPADIPLGERLPFSCRIEGEL